MDKRQSLFALAQDQRGATAIEYGLILALIVLAMMVALKGLANANTAMWHDVSDKVARSTNNA